VREESRALLRLLLESGQSYDDIAGVLGSDRAAVRERARDALAQLGGDRPGPELTDYLLGQASPVERADMARRLSADQAEAARAAELAERLREVAPQAAIPSVPGVAGDAREGASRMPDGRDGAPTTASRTRLALALAAIGILAAGVILAVTGALGDDEEEPPPQQEVSLEDVDAVRVELAPTGEGEASGEAVLGLATADQPFVDLTMQGLGEIEATDAYILWLMADDERGWPLGLVEPDPDAAPKETVECADVGVLGLRKEALALGCEGLQRKAERRVEFAIALHTEAAGDVAPCLVERDVVGLEVLLR
jgi:hypothetical protein